MDRLSILLSMLTGAVLTGTLTVTAFGLGYYAWWAVLASAAIGFALAWPAAFLISRRIKRNDPDWEEGRIAKVDRLVPDPRDSEV